MKKQLNLLSIATLLICVLQGAGQGTAFTYQGRLTENGNLANGIYEFRFTIYDAADSGNLVGTPTTNSAVTVSNGLFTTTLNFGAGIFAGADRWLEIAVRTNGGAFTLLENRQPLTATPYAITAGNLVPGGIAAGTYTNAITFSNSANSFSGGFIGNGLALTNVNAATLNNLAISNFWKLGANPAINPTNDFLGTTENQPLDVRVEGRRALRLESATNAARGYGPNVIGGYEGNSIAPGVIGATIAGGGRWDPSQDLSHHITAHHGTIGGGDRNTVDGEDGTIAGGGGNAVSANYSSIGGGLFNFIMTNAHRGTIGGGVDNQIGGTNHFPTSIDFGEANGIAAGAGNWIGRSAAGSFIGGGENNVIETNVTWGVVGGGLANTIGPDSLRYATIGGGHQNQIGGNRTSLSILGGEGNAVGGGVGNYIGPNSGGFIGGGYLNSMQYNSVFATIAGGIQNVIQSNAFYATIAGGFTNFIGASAGKAAIGGGRSEER